MSRETTCAFLGRERWWLQVLGLCLLVSGSGLAEVLTDRFGDSSKDGSTWGAEASDGSGQLKESNERLNFAVPSASALDYAEWPWIRASLTAGSSWLMEVTLVNDAETSRSDQVATLGLWARPQGSSEELWLEHYVSSLDPFGNPNFPAEARAGFASAITQHGDDLPSQDSGDQPVRVAALRMTYDATTGVLRAFYNSSPDVEEAAWVELGNHSIHGGNAGRDSNVDWGMGADSVFDVGLYGYAENTVIAEGAMRFTSFSVDTEYVPPVAGELDAREDRRTVVDDPDKPPRALFVLRNDVAPVSVDDLMVVGVRGEEGADFETTVSTAQGGVVETDGREVFYQPPVGFRGEEVFFYRVVDPGTGAMAEARVTLAVVDRRLPGVSFGAEMTLWGRILNRLMSASEDGRRLLGIVRKHRVELILILANDPALGGNTIEFPDEAAEAGAPQEEGEVARQEAPDALQRIYNELLSGATAVVAGQGDSVRLSEEMVDAVVSLRKAIREVASPELAADMDQELEGWDAKEDYVGMTFDQTLERIGLDPADVAVPVTRASWWSQAFSLTTGKIEGLAYTLWKSVAEDGLTWSRVEAEASAPDEATLILTDPEAKEAEAIYRVTTALEGEDPLE